MNKTRIIATVVMLLVLVQSTYSFDYLQGTGIAGNIAPSFASQSNTYSPFTVSQTMLANSTSTVNVIQTSYRRLDAASTLQYGIYFYDAATRSVSGTNDTTKIGDGTYPIGNETTGMYCYFGLLNVSAATASTCTAFETCRLNITNTTGCSITNTEQFAIVLNPITTPNSTNRGNWQVASPSAYADGQFIYRCDTASCYHIPPPDWSVDGNTIDTDITLYGAGYQEPLPVYSGNGSISLYGSASLEIGGDSGLYIYG